jgi:hypothetical protein
MFEGVLGVSERGDGTYWMEVIMCGYLGID